MHQQYSSTLLLNTPPLMVKNEMDVAYKENNQTNSMIFYSRCSNLHPHFSGQVVVTIMTGGDITKT